MSAITHITSTDQLNKLLKANPGGLTVIDFHATWCGPCHAIAPKYEELSKKYPAVKFLKCDVDAAQDVAQKYNVSAMPTFKFIKDEEEVDQVRGADPGALETALKTHASGGTGLSDARFPGVGQRLGGPAS